ncbi:hypothetical protein ColTof4_05561 [Colletotrichum tofieldiae]|nr:hypothetical protein ColTof3_00721 [Colletotrichum tofieldiae]GKT73138.1 hypothetical protein ColTof4_05561 [Colletotrichum tofieldiae]GKT88192.1 hypothetical protein Ct61P_06042 [Colletotrichum tofieldiae]
MDFNGATERMNNFFSLEEKKFAAEFAESKHLDKGVRDNGDLVAISGVVSGQAIKLAKKINDSN